MIKIERLTKRWLIKSFLLIMAVLVLVETVIIFLNRKTEYSAVQQAVKLKATVIQSTLADYAEENGSDYNERVRGLIENFESKDQMELIAVNKSKKAVMTSSGFSPTSIEIPELMTALKSKGQTGEYTGHLQSGEHIYSLTVASPVQTGDIIALRLMVSLTLVDKQILRASIMFVVTGIAIVLVILLTNLLFLHSIVKPITEVEKTARKIALGDFEARIENKYKDEMGDLCDIVNYMADELKQSENMKNEFISSVSHELRTPLTSIRGWGETISDEENCNTEMRKKGLGVIINETERLSSIVEELLDFSKIQSGHFSIKREKMDILAELEEAILVISERASKEGIQINYNEPQMLSPIYGDKNRIRQVFTNILDNAIKYSESGTTVDVNAYEEYSIIYIKITDHGCGISADDLPKIKEKFYKANLTKRGSGIGLAVVDEIVTMLDGTFEIESRLNVGTTVTLSFPTVNCESSHKEE